MDPMFQRRHDEVTKGDEPLGAAAARTLGQMTVGSDLALATRDLRKSYGKRVALAGLDLSVPTGVVYGFLGPNGAGKTTTMRLLTGLLHPDSGSIHLLGSPFTRGDRRRLFRVGALIEQPSFYPYLNGRQNLRELAATGAPVPKNRVEELLELVGLRDRAKDKVAGYSLGMKQRLGIAAALLSDPQLLLLDEPANGLDPAGIVAMRETLRHLAATGKTVFVSSHLLAEIQVMADVVGIIAAGRLVREGTMQQLLGSQQVVRLRLQREDADAALKLLTAIAPTTAAPDTDRGATWLSVRTEPHRAAELNRLLAGAGLFASGIESGSDLEMLFLELTGGEPVPGSEGTFQGIGASGVTGGSPAAADAPAADAPREGPPG
jgi:ABC-2 type transport system ATP-binding protein